MRSRYPISEVSAACGVTLLTLVLRGPLEAAEKKVSWNPAEATPKCDTRECSQVPMRPGQVLRVVIKPALPSVYDYPKPTEEDASTQTVSGDRLPWPNPKAPAAGGGETASPEPILTNLGCAETVSAEDLAVDTLFVKDEAAASRVKTVLERRSLWDPARNIKPLNADQAKSAEVLAGVADCQTANKGDSIYGMSNAPPSAGPTRSSPYSNLIVAAEALESALYNHQLEDYKSLVAATRASYLSLASSLKLDYASPSDSVAEALVQRLGLPAGAKASLSARVETLRTLLRTLPRDTGEVVIYTREFADQDVTLRIKAEPKTAILPGSSPRWTLIRLTLSNRWSYLLTSGIMFSGLVDEEYSRHLVIDERNMDGSAKASHYELTKESSDKLNTEAALLGALFPLQDCWGSDFGVFLGLGLDSQTTARYYAGVGYRLGRVGLITAGVATGKTKTLKESVNPKNSGDTTATDALRERRRTAFVVGLSFGLGQ